MHGRYKTEKNNLPYLTARSNVTRVPENVETREKST